MQIICLKEQGRALMFWQILESKNKIPFTMIEVDDSVDGGNYIYAKRIAILQGIKLNYELKPK